MNKENIFNLFISQNPEYIKLVNKLLQELKKVAPEEQFDITDDCFIYTIMGLIDRLFFDEGAIDIKTYKYLRKLLYQISEFNYFGFYNSLLFNVKNLPSDSQILGSIEEENSGK